MRALARVAAFVVGLLVVGRDIAVAGAAPAMLAASGLLVLFMAGALTLWRDGLVTASGLALAGHYVGSLAYGDVRVDLGAPVVGALVLLYLDLADLATSVPGARHVDRALLVRSARGAGVVLATGIAVGAAAFALAAGPWPSAEWVRAAGALGVAAVVLAPLILFRRPQ